MNADPQSCYFYSTYWMGIPEHGIHGLLREEGLLRDLVAGGVGQVAAVRGGPAEEDA